MRKEGLRVMMRYRELRKEDIEMLIRLRMSQLREEGGDGPDLAGALRDYYRSHLSDGSFFALLAEEDGEIVGAGGMSVVEKPPYFGCPTGRIGLLSGMYTRPDRRRRGIAREILARLTDAAREKGCGTVQITASEMGMKLYAAFGFRQNGRFMDYKL